MRYLIVDDNEAFRQLLCVILHDHEIIMAKDGAEAIACAECYQPDVILMDVMMPGMDGFEALRHLKMGEHTAGIPVVLMSAGCGTYQDVKRGLDLGAADYLRKPFSFDLGKRLEGYVAKKEPGKRARLPTTPI